MIYIYVYQIDLYLIEIELYPYYNFISKTIYKFITWLELLSRLKLEQSGVHKRILDNAQGSRILRVVLKLIEVPLRSGSVSQ